MRSRGQAQIILFIIILAIVGAGAYYFGTQKGKISLNLTATSAPVQTVTASATPESTPADVTANWKLFTDDVQKVSFKYSQTWKFAYEKGENNNGNVVNAQITLTKGEAKIMMNLNMLGIGGVGRDYDGIPVTVSGLKLYEYVITPEGSNITITGITDQLKQSLGLFQYKGKTYSISMSYPSSFDSTGEGKSLQDEYNLILSTFKFTD